MRWDRTQKAGSKAQPHSGMSPSTSLLSLPEDTARVARAAFPHGNRYLTLRAEFGALYTDEAFQPLCSGRGRPAVPPWRLALVTVVQFLEGLSDRQAADQVRARIDLKYLLGLPLEVMLQV